MKENVHQTTQIIGSIVAGENLHHAELLRSSLEGQDLAFAKAVEQISKVRDFVGSPEHILGSNLTKHGEIAEQVEVGVRNARDFLRQHPISATVFEHLCFKTEQSFLKIQKQKDPEFTPTTSIPYCCCLPALTRFERCNRISPSQDLG